MEIIYMRQSEDYTVVRTRHLDFYRTNLVCLCGHVFSSFYVGTGENAKELGLLIEPKAL